MRQIPIRARVTLRQAVACWQDHVEQHEGNRCDQCGFTWIEGSRRGTRFRVFRDQNGRRVVVHWPMDVVSLLGGPPRFKTERAALDYMRGKPQSGKLPS